MLIRPVTMNDHSAMMSLADKAGYGMTSLPQDAQVLEAKIKYSEDSFAGGAESSGEERFLLVLEDATSGEIVGSTGIKTHVGLSSPFYSYKLSTLIQASVEPKVYARNRVLHMVNDYTGVSEIGSLFLRKTYRRDGWGKCLSRCRFLLAAQFPQYFSDTIIAEMRGVHDENGHSPFYAHLAKHFFKMAFHEADYINATKGGQFIADLMPKYPIYEKLLAPEAQAVIGVVNEASKPALLMLKREGFRYQGYLDIFDAGPTVAAETKLISTVQNSRLMTVKSISPTVLTESKFIVMTTDLASLKIMQIPLRVTDENEIIIFEKDAEKLGVSVNKMLRVVEV